MRFVLFVCVKSSCKKIKIKRFRIALMTSPTILLVNVLFYSVAIMQYYKSKREPWGKDERIGQTERLKSLAKKVMMNNNQKLIIPSLKTINKKEIKR